MTEEQEFVEKTEMFEALEQAGFTTDRMLITSNGNVSTIEPAYSAEELLGQGFKTKGTKVKFLNRNGYDHHLKRAQEAGMKEGDEFTIKITHIGDWSSDHEFEEIEGRYNTVMFS